MLLSDDLRRERKKVNFGPDTVLKAATQNPVNSTENTSVGHAANIGSHGAVVRHSVNRHWGIAGVRASNRNTHRSSSGGNTSLNTDSHPSSKFTTGVPSRLSKSCSDIRRNTDMHTNKVQVQHSAVVSNGKDSIAQSEPQEVTPKLPLNTDSHPSSKFTTGVPSRLAKSFSDVRRNTDMHTNKPHVQHSAVVGSGKDSTAQSEPQEVTPKLPEELIRAGWKLCWSKQRHRWYVFNVRTGTSSWDVPK